jgi:hypothetical protein
MSSCSSQLENTNNQHQQGGDPLNQDKEALYKYKAKKYHYKIQQALKTMLANGQSVPAGYEKYLTPFSI